MNNTYMLFIPNMSWTGGPNRDHHESVTPSLSPTTFTDPLPPHPSRTTVFYPEGFNGVHCVPWQGE